MPETQSHRRAKRKAAGKRGRTEVKLPNGKRLDAMSKGRRATEVERSSNKKSLEAAARRLKSARAKQRVLQVPQKNLTKARAAMRAVKVAGTVKNMSGSQRQYVSKSN